VSQPEVIPLRFVFDQPDPLSPDLVFVEVETLAGKSVRVGGEWEDYIAHGHSYKAFTARVLAEDVEG
jgi:hypothetical protein